ncbi:DUF4278 domain-containing protein [Microcoleus sp. herbarium12]|uniref:DUF4278 domain-containing protein n=1 Tax=Microcoleus sp. herbarium12 TaxID=3055437 RepID=UPI002FD36746
MKPQSQLTYRGASYDRETLKDANYHSVPRETPYTLCYRGVTYQVNPQGETAEVPVQRLTRPLIYRGQTYCVNQTVLSERKLTSKLTQSLT